MKIEGKFTMKEYLNIFPVGVVKKEGETTWVEIDEKYEAALLGLEEFSHITVCYWFHKNDTPEKRNVLQVHPRKNPNNPLTGVFATHSPVRPNLMALSICNILSIKENIIFIDKIDAFDGSPVIDIKCYVPSSVPKSEVRLPEWI
jgi:tRNA-Thr(GGU) m(6)t(6)A37 methyltransferase TsaA